MQQRDRERGNERRLLGRLGDDRIAGDERGADLAEKDRQRKIPRADADEHAAPAIAQFVALAGRAGQRLRRKRGARLRGVIAAIIDRFAQLGERVVERLAGLRSATARCSRPRLRSSRSAARSSTAARASTGVAAQAGKPAAAAATARARSPSSASTTMPTSQPSIGERTARSTPDSATPSISGAGCAGAARAVAHIAQQRFEACAVAEFDARRVAPLRLIEIARQRNFAIARVACAPAIDALRPAQDCRDRHVRIGGDRDERRVGAVLQKPPHQISQKIAMAADRRIDPAGGVGKFGAEARRTAPRPCRRAAGTRSLRRRRRPRSRWRRSARYGWRIAETDAGARPAVSSTQAM